MARTEFSVTKPIEAAVAFVTAQLSPYAQPDPRLVHNDYGASMPHGGTSQPKLFGAYKLYINGVMVGMDGSEMASIDRWGFRDQP